MPVLLARVDNRLVHGQVLEAWVPRLAVNAILVVDPELVGDSLQQGILEGLSRPGLEIRLVGPLEAADLLDHAWANKRVLLIFRGVCQAIEALQAGVCYERLSLGNVHPRPESRLVTPSVYLTDGDVGCLATIAGRGVELEARAVPADKSPDLLRVVEGWG